MLDKNKKSTSHTINITGLGSNGQYRIKKYLNKFILNINKQQNLENCMENFWKIGLYGTTKDVNPSLLPQNEKKALHILEKTVTNIDGHYCLRLLWRNKFPNLPNKRSLTLFLLLDKKKKKENPEFYTQY